MPPVRVAYCVSLGGSSNMKKHVPDCENAARNRTPVVVSLLTVVGFVLDVVSSTHVMELSSPAARDRGVEVPVVRWRAEEVA